MRGRVMLVIGGVAGYVLGSRAGRRRYEQISAGARRAWETPTVQRGAEAAQQAVQAGAKQGLAAGATVAKEAVAKVADAVPHGGSGDDAVREEQNVSAPDLKADVAADQEMR